MIYVGIDDTDMPDTPGTNQLARALAQKVSNQFHCKSIIRHQLLDDPRVPYTSKNGSASLLFEPVDDHAVDLDALIVVLRTRMLEWFIEGSDPGLCVTRSVPDAIIEFGRRCQLELMARQEAERLAKSSGIHLEGLGGTCGGMIGALAAVGLVATGNDGRIVVNGSWPDDLSGPQPVELIERRNVIVRSLSNGDRIRQGLIDVGKHLRPNLRNGQYVLFAEQKMMSSCEWEAVRLL